MDLNVWVYICYLFSNQPSTVFSEAPTSPKAIKLHDPEHRAQLWWRHSCSPLLRGLPASLPWHPSAELPKMGSGCVQVCVPLPPSWPYQYSHACEWTASDIETPRLSPIASCKTESARDQLTVCSVNLKQILQAARWGLDWRAAPGQVLYATLNLQCIKENDHPKSKNCRFTSLLLWLVHPNRTKSLLLSLTAKITLCFALFAI